MEASEEHVGNNAEVIEDITPEADAASDEAQAGDIPVEHVRPEFLTGSEGDSDDDSPRGVIGTMLKNGTLAAAYITGLGIGLAGILVGWLAAGGNRRS
jgi:hypothetical protein